ncbi:MAG: CDC27 family protein [bacterium]
MEWFLSRKRMLMLGLIGVGLAAMFLLAGGYSPLKWSEDSHTHQEFKTIQDQITSDPFNPSLLLKGARKSYHLARQSFRARGSTVSDTVLKTGLRYYRRLLSKENWHLKPKDYFYAGYLYHKLGPHYIDRARELALEAYNRDYRSRELTTLLAVVQFQEASSKEQYRVALEYFESLGSDLRDPVLLYNKALTLNKLGRAEKALSVLKRGQKFIKAVPNSSVLTRRYRLARARILFDSGQVRNALEEIDRVPQDQQGPHLRTLYARCLIELDRTEKARTVLQEIVTSPNPPEEAKTLLKNITDQQKARS